MKIHIIKCLEDNYCYAIEDSKSKKLILVDTPEFTPIDQFLEKNNLKVTDILNTHHHGDHVGANLDLKAKYSCTIWGSLEDSERIPGIDKKLKDKERFKIGEIQFLATQVPGHTSHHLTYFLPQEKILFSGDTLFSMGCGRLFEGSFEQMFHSLKDICGLPLDTQIYCGHEYSEKNARFALSVDAKNPDLIARSGEVLQLRRQNQPTVPTSLALELKINPFLRAKTLEEFRNLRKLREVF